jgi:hypothetical protein
VAHQWHLKSGTGGCACDGRSGMRPVSIVFMSETKAGTDNRLGRAVLAHVCQRLDPSTTRYTFIWVMSAHLARRVWYLFDPSCHKQSVTKKTGKYFIFTGIFEPTKYDDNNI